MRRISKAICVALSLSLLINLAGFEVLAADVNNQQTESAENNTKEENVTDNSKTDAPDESTVPKADLPGTVINDDDVNADDSDTDAADKKDEVKEEAGDVSGQDTEEPAVDVQGELDEQANENIKAEPVSGRNKLKISWNAVTGATGYKVEVYKFDNQSELVKEYTVGNTTSQEIDATAGAKYLVKVTAALTSGNQEIGKIPAVLLAAPGVTATAGSEAVKLSWEAVTGATAYQVIHESKTYKVNAPETSYDVKNLTNGTKYSFQIKTVCEISYGSKTYSYTSDITTVTATPKSEKPAKVTGLSGIDGEKSAILTWSKAARADSYTVYRYNSSSKKWEAVKKNITKLTYTDTKLTSGKTYKYRVAAVNDGGTGDLSETITISVKKTPGTKVRTIGYKAIVKSRAPLFTSKSSKKRVKYLSKGTRVTTIDYGKGRYQIKLSNGKTYWLSKDRLTFTASIWTTKDYSTKVKEDFVNKKGYKSSSKYLIWINAYTQRVMIFQGKKGQWKMIRNCRCATGTHLHPTPKGTFKITYKEKGWFYRTTYEKPIVHFKSQNSFHSRIKNYKGGYADATIGKPRSKGCVRLYDEDINFIYKKCPKGTTVVSH